MRKKQSLVISGRRLRCAVAIFLSGLIVLGMLPMATLPAAAESDYNVNGQFGIGIGSDFSGLNLDGIDETQAEAWKWGDFSEQPYWKNDPEHAGKLIAGTAEDYNLKYESGKLYLKALNLVVMSAGEENAVFADGDLTIVIEEGDSSITCNGGIPIMTTNNLTFEGAGNLTVTAEGFSSQCAILANNQVTHNGSGTITLHSSGAACGIFWLDESGGSIDGSGLWSGTELEWTQEEFDNASRRTYTDGEDHIGYSGCYMSQDEYDDLGVPFWSGDPAWCYDNPLVWVHGRTIQEVIDKLSGKTPVILYDSLGNVAANIDSFKTEYIYIAVSISNYTAEQKKADEEYITSTRDFRAISIRGGWDYQMTNHEKTGNILVEDAVYTLNSEAVEILKKLKSTYGLSTTVDFDTEFPYATMDDVSGYVSLYKDEVYVAKQRTAVDMEHPYSFDLGDKIASLSELKEAVEAYNASESSPISVSDNLLMSWMRPEIHLPFATLHINSSCDFKIGGEFSEIQEPKNPEGINVYFGFLPNTDHSLTIVQDGYPEMVYTKEDTGSLRGVVNMDLHYGDPGGSLSNPVKFLIYQHITDGSVSGSYANSVVMDNASIPDATLLAGVDITDEQLDILESGEAVDIDLSVDKMDLADVENQSVVTDITRTLQDTEYESPVYMDLHLLASIRNANGEATSFSDGQDAIPLTELNEPVSLTMAVPEEIKAQGQDRTYAVLRRHVAPSGEISVDILPVTYHADAATLTFDTDKFSEYAVVYKDAVTSETPTTTTETPTETTGTSTTAVNETPKTGDTMPLAWVIGFLGISLAGVIGTAVVNGKKAKR